MQFLRTFHLVPTLLALMAPSTSHALGKGKPARVHCNFSAPASKYEALLEKILGGARKPGNPGRPPAMALYLVDSSGSVVRVIHESSAHDPRPVASTQKMLTAWLALQSTSLDQSITYTSEDDWHDSANDGNPAKRRDGSLVQVGETVTVRELLQTLLEQSSNAAASALARAAAGSHRDFVRSMNASVHELLRDEQVESYFQNSSGLTDDQPELRWGELPTVQHSTTNNLARMMARIMARPATSRGADFSALLEGLAILNSTGTGIFEKYGRTRAAGRTVLVHWRLPCGCASRADALVLAAFGGWDDQIASFVLEIERMIGLSPLRTRTLTQI